MFSVWRPLIKLTNDRLARKKKTDLIIYVLGSSQRKVSQGGGWIWGLSPILIGDGEGESDTLGGTNDLLERDKGALMEKQVTFRMGL